MGITTYFNTSTAGQQAILFAFMAAIFRTCLNMRLWNRTEQHQEMPANDATVWPVTPLRLELGSYWEGLELTDDILNSEAELHALYLKWLSKQDCYHFDVEDEKAFNKRFEIFKDTARDCHQHNKTGSSYWMGLTCLADLSHEEFVTSSWKSYPKKLTTTANQVIADIAVVNYRAIDMQ